MPESEAVTVDRPQWAIDAIKAHGEKRTASYKKHEAKALLLKEKVRALEQ
jgi:hypothetical protein